MLRPYSFVQATLNFLLLINSFFMSNFTYFTQLYIYSFQNNMCFIKTVLKTPELSSPLFKQDLFNTETNLVPQFKSDMSLFDQVDNSKLLYQENQMKSQTKANLNGLFANILSYMDRNSRSIEFLDQRIQNCSNKLQNLFGSLSELKISQKQENSSITVIDSLTSVDQKSKNQKEQTSQNCLVNNLFGQKKYRFKLVLAEEFTKVIYKERNINIKVNLVNLNGKNVKNANMINLCLSICSDNSEWISMNRVGDPMLKGKTQIELYHGAAQFNKIYSKDISRTFPNGRINFVIYAKPSLLIYNGTTNEYEQSIDFECIEPLIIDDVTIKAKKKN